MAKTRKISDCINLRISLGNYQHIEFIKYSEEQIEYSTEDDRKKQEDALHADLVDSLIRSVRGTPARFNGTGQAQEVEESIKKKIPEWLEKNTVPNIAVTNIANAGPKREIQVQAIQNEVVERNKAFLDVDKKKIETKIVSAPVVTSNTNDDLFEDEKSSTVTPKKDDDLFDDEPTPPKKQEVVVTPKVDVKAEKKLETPKAETPKAETPKAETPKVKSTIDDFGSDDDFDTDDFLK